MVNKESEGNNGIFTEKSFQTIDANMANAFSDDQFKVVQGKAALTRLIANGYVDYSDEVLLFVARVLLEFKDPQVNSEIIALMSKVRVQVKFQMFASIWLAASTEDQKKELENALFLSIYRSRNCLQGVEVIAEIGDRRLIDKLLNSLDEVKEIKNRLIICELFLGRADLDLKPVVLKVLKNLLFDPKFSESLVIMKLILEHADRDFVEILNKDFKSIKSTEVRLYFLNYYYAGLIEPSEDYLEALMDTMHLASVDDKLDIFHIMLPVIDQKRIDIICSEIIPSQPIFTVLGMSLLLLGIVEEAEKRKNILEIIAKTIRDSKKEHLTFEIARHLASWEMDDVNDLVWKELKAVKILSDQQPEGAKLLEALARAEMVSAIRSELNERRGPEAEKHVQEIIKNDDQSLIDELKANFSLIKSTAARLILLKYWADQEEARENLLDMYMETLKNALVSEKVEVLVILLSVIDQERLDIVCSEILPEVKIVSIRVEMSLLLLGVVDNQSKGKKAILDVLQRLIRSACHNKKQALEMAKSFSTWGLAEVDKLIWEELKLAGILPVESLKAKKLSEAIEEVIETQDKKKRLQEARALEKIEAQNKLAQKRLEAEYRRREIAIEKKLKDSTPVVSQKETIIQRDLDYYASKSDRKAFVELLKITQIAPETQALKAVEIIKNGKYPIDLASIAEIFSNPGIGKDVLKMLVDILREAEGSDDILKALSVAHADSFITFAAETALIWRRKNNKS